MSESTETGRSPVVLGSPMTDLDGAYRLSKALAMASVMPDALRGKPSDVLALMLYGQDLGMSPMQAIQSIYVVKGKPQLSATGWIALAQRAGYRITEIESTDERATVEISHPGRPDRKPHRETYTLERAAKAGLVHIKDGKAIARSSKGDPLPWEAHTQIMLRNRALTTAAKFYCPEVALGFDIEGGYAYIPDDTMVEVLPPEVVEDVVVSEKAAEEVASLVGEFDFTTSTEKTSAGAVIQPEPPADYTCFCGAVGEHFEDDCPKAAADA